MRRGTAILNRLRACCLIILGFGAALARAERIIAEGDTWRFRNGWVYPYPTGWTTNGYDDSVTGWFSLKSGFGYGDADDGTNLSDMQNAGTTFFTRKTFVVSSPAGINYMTLGVDYDDGFVAYINGTEVARRNVTGAVTNNTVAAGNHEASRGEGGSSPQEKEFIALNPSVLVAGTNVIAVSGHNISLSSSDASLIVEVFTNVTLVRGPFIQLPDTNNVTVVWRTDALTDSAVDYGLTTGYEAGTTSDATLVREHVVQLPGLQPNTNYYYRVRSGGVTLGEGVSFPTRRTAGQPFRFVVLGDFGQGTEGMTNVAQQINATDFDFLVTVGDNVYGQAGAAGGNSDGAPGWYDPFWFKLYAPSMARAATFVTLGNHDVDTANGQWSVDYFFMPTNGPAGQLEKNYSFDYGNAHFVVVDTEPFEDNQTAIMDAIRTWTSNDLAAATQPWKFVFLHRPPHTSIGSHNDQTNVKTHLTPLFALFGVQMVFQGHNHWYERINPINGVNYITSGGGGAGLYPAGTRKEYSAVLRNDIHSFTIVDVDGTRLTLREIDKNGAQIDEFKLDIGHKFKVDGLLDDAGWQRADNGLKLYAAIRGNYLYAATQDAGEGGDNFIYVNNMLSTNRAANWAKTGIVMQWNAFLADENDGAFQRWYDETQQFLTNFPSFQSMTSGLNNNGSFDNGALEGTIDLANRFGAFPQQLYLAAAAFATTNAGPLTAVVPGGNAAGTVTNWLSVNTRDIALDLPVADAGTPQTIEAGMTAQLSGAGSTAPSELPLSYNWTQLTGPAVTLVNSNTTVASFASTVDTNAVVTFQLTINDTRFDSNDTTTVTLTGIVDTDGDGLSDAEEDTGLDNVLTAPDPNGQLTDKTRADTDGDGADDGAEALAGTNPNNSSSSLRVTRTDLGGGGFLIEWDSVAGKTYRVQYRDNLATGWSDVPGDVMATGSTTNKVDSGAVGLPVRFYRVVIP
jgi:hypothetical protein